MQARLSARDLACRRGERLLFRKLTLDLGPGDMLHVRGPNGVGKTSLMRILAGLARPFAGEVERTGEVGLVDGRHALDLDRELGDAMRFWARLDGTGDPTSAMERLLPAGEPSPAKPAHRRGEPSVLALTDQR